MNKRHSIRGSERHKPAGARLIGAADPHELVTVTVLLRRRPSSPDLAEFVRAQSSASPRERQHLSREEFAKIHGADEGDIDKVEQFAHEFDLNVVDVRPTERRVVLSGAVSQVSSAFGVYLAQYEHSRGRFRGRVGDISIPDDLSEIVEGVFGLDSRSQAQPHFRVLADSRDNVRAAAVSRSYTPLEIARLYNFPTDATGHDQCIGIIELGGGYRAQEMRKYFQSLNITAPTLRSVSVDGAHNKPTGDANGPDGEVCLDIEVAGAIAPGAKLAIYFAPNTDAGFLDAISSAVHDTRNRPGVISISWGAAESEWTQQAMNAMDQAFQEAAALGVSVCAAAGDDGSRDNVNDGRAHVDFPASSPNVLACGGTRLEGSGTSITKESVWNQGQNRGATGGGVSDAFPLPPWQASAKIPPSSNPGARRGRGVPDVAGDADPATGYEVLVDGEQFVIGGTSAVAPLWAGLITLMNEKLGKTTGNLNPLLYALASGNDAFHDITDGANGAYKARSGWDACTGLGSPDGVRLLASLQRSN
jgi:kumamolisin